MRKFYYSLSFYVFFLITFTSAHTFAYIFSTADGSRVTLAQEDSGDHLVWISGCSFKKDSEGEIDALLALANWNNPISSDSVFRGEWVDCGTSADNGRWSRLHNQATDYNEIPTSQIVVTRHLQGTGLVGQQRRTTDFSTNKAVAFTIFVRPSAVAGEFTCDSTRGSSLKMTLTHELGHGLGLKHTQPTRWASLRKFLPNGYYCDIHSDQTIADIHPDDSAALQSAYPVYDVYQSAGVPTHFVSRSYYDLAASAYENSSTGTGTTNISRADPPDSPTNRYCPGDTIPDVEFSVANQGNIKLKYTRTFWSSRTTDLSTGDKSRLFRHDNRIKSPGARVGVYQGKQDLIFSDSDLPPVGETWFLVMQLDNVRSENGTFHPEDRSENNGMVHSSKIRRSPSCP